MPLDITCHQCGRSFRISDDVAGKHFRCVGCRTVLKAPQPSAPQQETPAPRKLKSEPQARQDEQNPPDSRPRHSAGLPRRGNRPKNRPDPVDENDDDDPFGYGLAQEASEQGMPVRQNMSPRRKSRTLSLRSSNPDAFADYDRIVNEIAIFWIGLAVIVGALAGLFYGVFLDGGSGSDRTRQENIIFGMAVIAGASFLVGLITFSHSRIWLYLLFPIVVAFLVSSLALAFMVRGLMWILPISFCVMYVRLQKAHAAHP